MVVPKDFVEIFVEIYRGTGNRKQISEISNEFLSQLKENARVLIVGKIGEKSWDT